MISDAFRGAFRAFAESLIAPFIFRSLEKVRSCNGITDSRGRYELRSEDTGNQVVINCIINDDAETRLVASTGRNVRSPVSDVVSSFESRFPNEIHILANVYGRRRLYAVYLSLNGALHRIPISYDNYYNIFPLRQPIHKMYMVCSLAFYEIFQIKEQSFRDLLMLMKKAETYSV